MYKLPHAQLVRRSVGRCFFFLLKPRYFVFPSWGKIAKVTCSTSDLLPLSLLSRCFQIVTIWVSSLHICKTCFLKVSYSGLGGREATLTVTVATTSHSRCALFLSLSLCFSFIPSLPGLSVCLWPVPALAMLWPGLRQPCTTPTPVATQHQPRHAPPSPGGWVGRKGRGHIALSAMETDCSGHARAVP